MVRVILDGIWNVKEFNLQSFQMSKNIKLKIWDNKGQADPNFTKLTLNNTKQFEASQALTARAVRQIEFTSALSPTSL